MAKGQRSSWQSKLLQPESTDLLLVWAGAQRLLNISSSWQEVADRLQHYTLPEVLNAVGRISAVLRNGDDRSFDLQLEICAGLLGGERAKAIARRVWLMRQKEIAEEGAPPSQYVLFAERSLQTLLQVAAQVLPADESSRGEPLNALGEALLIVNDLLSQEALTPQGIDAATPEGERQWTYFLSVQAAALGAEPAVHRIARAYDLFLTDRPELSGDASYIDLPALFTETTGLSISQYALVFFAFAGVLNGITAENVAHQNAAINLSYFSSLSITTAEIDRFFSVAGQHVAAFLAEMRHAYPNGLLRPGYRLPLERSPLVRFETTAVCLSLPLLEDRLTDGLYHILFNARPGNAGMAFRDRFMRYVGTVFERYVEGSFCRIAQYEHAKRRDAKPRARPSSRFISGRQLFECLSDQPGPTPSLCDGILVVADAIVLVESKARMLSLAARAGESEEEFFERMEDIVVAGARQLGATLRLLAAGSFRNLDLDPKNIRRAIPAIVSLQRISLNVLFKKWIDSRLAAEGLLQRRIIENIRISELELLDAGDLAFLELAAQSSRFTPVDVLWRKSGDDFGRTQSLSTWAIVRKVPPEVSGNARSHYHGERYHDLAELAKIYLRAHKHPSSPDEPISPPLDSQP